MEKKRRLLNKAFGLYMFCSNVDGTYHPNVNFACKYAADWTRN